MLGGVPTLLGEMLSGFVPDDPDTWEVDPFFDLLADLPSGRLLCRLDFFPAASWISLTFELVREMNNIT